jgi:hypothetical protein
MNVRNVLLKRKKNLAHNVTHENVNTESHRGGSGVFLCISNASDSKLNDFMLFILFRFVNFSGEQVIWGWTKLSYVAPFITWVK